MNRPAPNSISGASILRNSAESGNVELFKVADKLFCPWYEDLRRDLCRSNGSGNHTICADQHVEYADVDNSIIYAAIEHGHLEMTQYLVRNNFPVFGFYHHEQDDDDDDFAEEFLPDLIGYDASNAYMIAARFGRLDILKYLCESGDVEKNHFFIATDRIIHDFAAIGGNVECLKYLREQGFTFSAQVCNGAAESGNPSCLEYLRSQGCTITEETFAVATRKGKLEFLRHLVDHGCPINYNSVCKDGARSRDVKVLQFVHELGGKLVSKVSRISTNDYNSLECLYYYHKQGKPWDTRACYCAVKHSNHKALAFLLDNGCPWPGIDIEEIPLHYQLLEVLLSRQCVTVESFELSRTIAQGNIKVMQVLLKYGAQWQEDTLEKALAINMFYILRNSDITLRGVKYALENGCPWTPKAYEVAIHPGTQLPLLRYIFEKNLARDDGGSILKAIKSGRVDVLDFLFQQGIAINDEACREAERCRDVSILKFLNEKGFAIDKNLLH